MGRVAVFYGCVETLHLNFAPAVFGAQDRAYIRLGGYYPFEEYTTFKLYDFDTKALPVLARIDEQDCYGFFSKGGSA